jgi:hypothetical protein
MECHFQMTRMIGGYDWNSDSLLSLYLIKGNTYWCELKFHL